MYKHILIAVDGSELAAKALSQRLGLAKALAAKATVVTVTEPWVGHVSGEAALRFPSVEYDEAVAANATQILSKASAMATRVNVTCSTVLCERASPGGRHS